MKKHVIVFHEQFFGVFTILFYAVFFVSLFVQFGFKMHGNN